MKIVIIGAGNLAYHLATQMKKHIAEQNTNELIIANHKNNPILKTLKQNGFKTLTTLDNIPADADVYIICVKDAYIQEIACFLKNRLSKKPLVVHTSGAIESEVLNMFTNYGVLYPLYSFSFAEKNIQWADIPIYYIAGNNAAARKLRQVASGLNANMIFQIDDSIKLQIHLLAVLANNFVNALLYCMYELSAHADLQKIEIYRYVRHFAIKTIERTKNQNPAYFQTGPAIRNDIMSIKKHLDYLDSYPEIKELYQCFTAYIQNKIPHEQKEK